MNNGTVIFIRDIQRAMIDGTRRLPANERADELTEHYERLDAAWRDGCQAEVAKHMKADGVAR